MPFPNPFFMILYCPASGRAVNSMPSLPICESLRRLARFRVCLRCRLEQIAALAMLPVARGETGRNTGAEGFLIGVAAKSFAIPAG